MKSNKELGASQALVKKLFEEISIEEMQKINPH